MPTPMPTPVPTPAAKAAPRSGVVDTARTGRSIGPYHLGPLLGRGGMSDVFEARDRRSDTTVAVKVVRGGEPELATRLVQEARVLARLSHPGLVQLLDAGTADGCCYLVMELVRGRTLAAITNAHPLAPDDTARLGAQVADALVYVHARGVVHRDLKPSNILVGGDGRARIGDFGVSRLLDASTITLAGTTLGTVAYMAPEQLEGERVGPAADIWSLGLVLLECLQGRRVYSGSPGEVVARRLAAPVPMPVGLPVPWRLLLEGMLDHRPDRRLGAHQVASLLQSGAFAEPWTPGPRDDGVGDLPGHHTAAADPGAPPDLTALALAPASATALLVPGATHHDPSPRVIRRRPRRAGLAASVVAAAVVAGLLGAAAVVGLRDLGAGHPGPGADRARGGTQTSTTTTSTPTTTTLSPAQTASNTLASDLAAGEAAGTIDPSIGDQVSAASQQAAADARNGDLGAATDALAQAVALTARGVREGTIDATTASTIQADLMSLARALGVTGPSVSQSATVPGTPGGTKGGGNGRGSGHG